LWVKFSRSAAGLVDLRNDGLDLVNGIDNHTYHEIVLVNRKDNLSNHEIFLADHEILLSNCIDNHAYHEIVLVDRKDNLSNHEIFLTDREIFLSNRKDNLVKITFFAPMFFVKGILIFYFNFPLAAPGPGMHTSLAR
jgi:hypothetical protein